MIEKLVDWKLKAKEHDLAGITQGTNHECLCPDGTIIMITRSGNSVFYDSALNRPIPFLKSIGLIENTGIYMEYMTGLSLLKKSLLETEIILQILEFHGELKQMVHMYQDRFLEKNYFQIWCDCDISDEEGEIHFPFTSLDSNAFYFSIRDGEFTYAKIPKAYKQEFILKIRQLNLFLEEVSILIRESPSLFLS